MRPEPYRMIGLPRGNINFILPSSLTTLPSHFPTTTTSHHSLPFPPLNSLASPITPQATLAPEFPVVSESVCPPSPRSSSFACTTTDLPTTEYSPNSDTTPSVKHSLHSPFPSATRLPKSPTCLLVLLGPPWVVLCGL